MTREGLLFFEQQSAEIGQGRFDRGIYYPGLFNEVMKLLEEVPPFVENVPNKHPVGTTMRRCVLVRQSN